MIFVQKFGRTACRRSTEFCRTIFCNPGSWRLQYDSSVDSSAWTTATCTLQEFFLEDLLQVDDDAIAEKHLQRKPNVL